MNKSSYKFGIFFLGLTVVAGLLQSYIHFQLGSQMYYLQPYADWFLVVNLIYFIGTVFLLKYFHAKEYWFAFFSGAITTLFALTDFIITYLRLILVDRELDSYSLIIYIIALLTGIVFAFSLLFSKAEKEPWLKIAGVFTAITNLALVSAIIWNLPLRDVQMPVTFEKIVQWVSLLSNFISVFFIINFRSELRLLEAEAKEVKVPRRESLDVLIGAAGMIAFILFYFGLNVAQASISTLYWNKKGPERAQQLAKAFETRTYVSSKGDTMKYLFLPPLNYDAKKQYPLVVCLHGGPIPLNAPEVRPLEVPEPAPLLSRQENREKYPAFLLVPQGPPGFSWGGVPNSPAVDSVVFEIIQALEQEFSIDVKRRYVAGGSLGGYGSWYFIGTRPEMFAAAIPFCGAGNLELAPNMVDVPVWAFHGSIDRNVPVSGSREMVKAIKRAGGNPRYTEFPDVGHNVWPYVNDTPGLLEWLFAQKRD